jgi:hypothetical protein
MTPRLPTREEPQVETPTWWDDTEAFVVLNEVLVPARRYDAVDTDKGLVAFEAGEELPESIVTPGTWRSFGDTLAALDARGSRLDTPVGAEKYGDLEAEPALREWREGQDLAARRVSAFECETCGEVFPTRSALNGHMGSHTARSADEGEDTAETLDGDEDAESAEREADDETPLLTAEGVMNADEDALQDLARTHGLDPSHGEDRLRAELRDLADDEDDEDDEGPTTRTGEDLLGGESA